MIEEFNINIKELIDLHHCGDSITVRQKNDFDYDIQCLSKVGTRLINGKFIPLTSDQLCFVNKLLGFCIRNDIPKLGEILAVFDLKVDDTLCDDNC